MNTTADIRRGDYVRLRRDPQRPSRYDGLEWEVLDVPAGTTLFLQLVGGTSAQTCGATLEAVESVYRPNP
jgi:hypothetical protein